MNFFSFLNFRHVLYETYRLDILNQLTILNERITEVVFNHYNISILLLPFIFILSSINPCYIMYIIISMLQKGWVSEWLWSWL